MGEFTEEFLLCQFHALALEGRRWQQRFIA
jgi:hypothetical protein